jgi:hypothetical protein
MSATMTGKGQISWKRAMLAGVAGLAASACASSGRAPITYAGRTPAPPIAQSIPPQPLSAPAPLDLTAVPFDTATAPFVISDQPHSECVPYARNLSGIDIWGDAVTWWTQAATRYLRSSRPAPGSVLVLRGYNDLSRGHVSYVREVVSSRLMRIDHANWLKGGEISVNVPVIDVSPGNDWSLVRVWHVPGGYWGGRAYQAEGFIHPYRLNDGPPAVTDVSASLSE